MLAAGAAIYVLGRSLPVAAWRGWAEAVMAGIALLVALSVSYRLNRSTAQPSRLWACLIVLVVGLNGLAWGALGLIVLPESQAAYILFLSLVVALSAGAIYALAPILAALVAFLLPLIFGASLPLVLHPGSGNSEVVALFTLYCIVGAGTVWRVSRMIDGGYQSAFDAARQIVDLIVTKEALGRANEALQDELTEIRCVQTDLEENENHFRALVETSGDIVWAVDAMGCYTYVNGSAIEATLGYRSEEVIGAPFTQFAAAVSAQTFDDEFFKLIDTGDQLSVSGEFLHRNGHPVYLNVRAIVLHDNAGNVIGASGTAVDVSEIKAAEVLLKQALSEQNAILNSATVGIAFVQGGEIVRANSELEKIFGYLPGAMTKIAMDALCVLEGSQAWLATVNNVAAGPGVYDHDQMCRRRDGTDFWCRLAVRSLDDGTQSNATIWVVQDISDRKQKEQAIEHAALHDTLTGLPNRAMLSDRLQQTIKHAARANRKFGVLFIDLDRFKLVNDSVGHDGGDQLLRTVAERLRLRLRSGDTVARQGGDEFIIVLPEVCGLADIERVAENIRTELARPIQIFGTDYVVTCSIGISMYPDHGTDARALLKHADAAMYLAKGGGKDTYRVFTEELRLQASQEVQLENLLRVAMERQQLDVYYQPRIDLATGRICSLEALARWQHSDIGWIGPDKFIPVAERTGLIGRLGEWVLRRACKDLMYLSASGHSDFDLSVNLSHCQLSEPELVANVCSVLKEFDCDPRRLELELTETAIAQNAEQAVEIMKSFEAVGISIAVDDFGTGYSSLSQLKRFPIRTLKIDRSFVAGLPREEDDVAIVLAIIAMAKRLGMRVVAEGVETLEQRQFLMHHECEEGQGYLFGKPMPLSEIIQVLNASRRAPELVAVPDRAARRLTLAESQYK